MRKLALALVGLAWCACSNGDGEGPADESALSGGKAQTGGNAQTGGAVSTGGAASQAGAASRAGAASQGGAAATGGSAQTGGERARGGSAATTGGRAATGGNSANDGTLSERYPGDVGIADHEAVLFFDDFEQGWGRWDSPAADTRYLHLESDAAEAHSGERYLRSTVTREDLEEDEYISAAPSFELPRRVDAMYWRFHVRFPVVAPNPHHWIRVEAGDESYASSGLANTVPPGDRGFWFDFDIGNDDEFNFYTYWYKMRSGRCNDGSTTPGCAGDQGSSYHYGNAFKPADQTPFERNRWLCVELAAGVNQVGESDGWLAFWVNDVEVGRYAPGEPEGTWLRDSFHEGGCDFSACTEPVPFEGFDFRSAPDVQFKRIILDAYYERGSSADKREDLESRGLTPVDDQTILYDDIVVATQRIGCRRE